MDARQPDLIVGVDFGMTCTGVSYANFNRSKTAVRTIQSWPGRMQANENKVPTILTYYRSTRQFSKWGFEAESPLERDNADRQEVDWFKVLLDEATFHQMRTHDSSHAMPDSIDDVEGWFIDYLSALYKHIEFKLSSELPYGTSWSNALVEFIFSVPTTWQPQPTVEKFRSICARAGFSQHRSHSIAIGLTEAEAAAVHTSIESPVSFKLGEVLLVCDIGGGTTDLSVLKVQGIKNGNLQLEQMDVVQGRTIGSAKIDEAFQNLALQRLVAANATAPFQGNPQDVAWGMMKTREFQNAKCDFGSPDDTPIFAVPTFGIDPSYTNQSFNMLNGSMHFPRSDMQGLFDTQITGIFELIDLQIASFKRVHPGEKISHIILSGGLGNSAYVQGKLKERYTSSQFNSRSSMVPQSDVIQVLVAPEPQLAVCKGIVADRISILSSGVGVLPWRCARASYGMLCKVKYDPTNPAHRGKRTEPDPYTKEIFLTSCIEWFVRKGEAVNSSTPIVRPFTKKIPPGSGSRRAFPSSVVISHVDANKLPLQVNHDAHVVAEVTSDLSAIPENNFKLKNRHWWNSGKKYRRCEYDVKVVIGAADIRFELWFNGQKLSKDNPMPVEWHDTPAPSLGIGSNGNRSELPALSTSRRVGGAFPQADVIQRTSAPGTQPNLSTSQPIHAVTPGTQSNLTISQPIHAVTPGPTVSSVHTSSPALTNSVQSSSPGVANSVPSGGTGGPPMVHSHISSVHDFTNSTTNISQMIPPTGQPMASIGDLSNGGREVHELPQRQSIHELPLVSSPVQHVGMHHGLVSHTGIPQPGFVYYAVPHHGMQHPGVAPNLGPLYEMPSTTDLHKQPYQQVQEVQTPTGYPPQQSVSGYPSQQPASGYTPQNSQIYPQQPQTGYPPQQQQTGYPPQQYVANP